jgi:type II secretory pathway component GspD/PulD (secretin)
VIKKLDIPPLKVMIEVEMLDVNKGRLDQIGVNFANGAYASLTPGSRLTRWPWDNRFFSESSGGAEPGLTTLDLSGFTTVIQLLSQDQETKFLARPKILTLDKETATVNLTLNEVVGLTTTSDENGNISQEIERDDTGTKLEVTPQVNPDTNEITLVVDVSNKESTPSNISVSGMTAGFVQNIEERATRNIVRLKDGETLFIGGLMKKEEKEIITKIPFFGDLPLIGRLFRYKDRPLTDNAERELLVFLTPHILKEGESLIEKVHVLSREQQNFSKENSIKVALDRYNR